MTECMNATTKAKLVLLWVLLVLALAAVACDNSTEGQCPRACRELGLDYESATPTQCVCRRGDGVKVRAW